ncbi:hypothetical protein K8W59_08915 [Nocardioides rotundus]|uniref:hypothetical protein n=1 Tax=Nocardioides rotundus TaxID=1774216 RepID=UPI001CBCA29D|nr:hypothetical protein [Nocardioides rotundus]UAL31533.1 hypothetical protein K8W59_08915 [Nocardioides rotundus]
MRIPDALAVRGPTVHVVRWPRRDGRSVYSRFYFRKASALAKAGRLAGDGVPVRVFTTNVTWREVEL